MTGAIARSVSLLSAAALLLNGASASLDPVVVHGSKFFHKSDGSQFFIKGVAYQQGVGTHGGVLTKTDGSKANTLDNDPLADVAACERDVPLLKELGVNAIRTYAIDPAQSHKECMDLLDAAGIYVISDLGEPNLSIKRDNPAWNLDLYTRYTSVIDEMAQYSNVIGFFAGNEVTNNASYTPASAFVKAAVRDSKAYIKSKGYTTGVGYAADDGEGVRAEVAAYFNCGDSEEDIDFWGYNIYSWCDPSDYVSSHYQEHTETFASYNVPVFFAEYGCNTGEASGSAPRAFNEVQALYGPEMSKVFSGGIVYEYFQEVNDYGLVTLKSDDTVSKYKDFASYASQIRDVSPSSVNSADYHPTNTAGQACPTVGSNWKVAPSGLPPTPKKDVCDCMSKSLSCVANPDIEEEAIGDLFGTVCALSDTACDGFAYDSSKGVYGPYLGCNPIDQLSNAFNAYYLEQNSASTACDFGGNATVVEPSEPESTCSSVIASASAGATAGGGSSNGDGDSDSSTSDEGNAGSSIQASLSIGKWCWVAYLTTALVSGAGMFLL